MVNDVKFCIVKGRNVEDLVDNLTILNEKNVILFISNIIEEGRYLKMIVHAVTRIDDTVVEKSAAKVVKTANKGVKNGRK
jgi:hypothetical protein